MAAGCRFADGGGKNGDYRYLAASLALRFGGGFDSTQNAVAFVLCRRSADYRRRRFCARGNHSQKIADGERRFAVGGGAQDFGKRGFDNGGGDNKKKNDDSPLQTVLLRGGVRREPQWCKNPGAAAVCCGTVDQIGSRLLFRGYGVSDRATPIHAALVGADSLIALDEAHISGAFAETLTSLRDLRRPPLYGERKLPFHFLQMTATPGETDAPFGLEERRPRKSRSQKSFRGEKTGANRHRKPESVVVKSPRAVVSKLRDEAVGFANRLGGAIAVVANTVRTARAVFESLPKASEKILLTGRMRALDRDAILEKHIARFRAENRAVGDAPLFVVATQCIEVGADFDFDAMATELAPLDCLRQRFGRLNRLGARAESPAAIVWAESDLKTAEKRLPFYGAATRETADYLKSASRQRA